MEDGNAKIARLENRRTAPTAPPPGRRAGPGEIPGRFGPPRQTGRPPDVVAVIRRILKAAWRRRVLIVLPVVLMTLVGVAGALMMPKTYVARTLLMLQEEGRDNPLAPRGAADDRIRERVAGLDAMLKSETVLSLVVEQVAPEGAAATPRKKALLMRDLRDALSLDLIGTDFLEITLRGEKAEGMGNVLGVVTARFLEALVADDQGLNAGRFLAERRAAERAKAMRERDSAARRLAEARAAGSAEVPTLERILANREAALARAVAETESVAERFGQGAEPLRPVGLLNAPEQIVVVDPPTDPLLPASSRLIYAISALAAGVMLGAVLGFAAETLDPRVREPEDLAAAAGVPVLGRLPSFAPARTSPGASGRRAGWVLPVLVLVAAVAAGFLVQSRSPADGLTSVRDTATAWVAQVETLLKGWTGREPDR